MTTRIAICAVAVVALGGVITGCANKSDVAGGAVTSAPPAAGSMNSVEAQYAVSFAKARALDSSPGVRSEDTGWPSTVVDAEAFATTRTEASKFVGSAIDDTTRVLVVRLTGQFTWTIPAPQGEPSTETGNMVTYVVDPASDQVLDAGIEQVSDAGVKNDSLGAFPSDVAQLYKKG